MKEILNKLEIEYKKEYSELGEASWNKREIDTKIKVLKDIKREIKQNRMKGF